MKVATTREFEARYYFLRHGGTADDVAALEDGDGKTGASEIRGGDEAVVATTDHKGVPFLVRQRGGAQTSTPHFSMCYVRVGCQGG